MFFGSKVIGDEFNTSFFGKRFSNKGIESEQNATHPRNFPVEKPMEDVFVG
jgi:hypothetical protein